MAPDEMPPSKKLRVPLTADGAPPLGIPANETVPDGQTGAWKELINKLAWVLGSTYSVPYGNPKTPARDYAMRMARKVLMDHGYPSKISK